METFKSEPWITLPRGSPVAKGQELAVGKCLLNLLYGKLITWYRQSRRASVIRSLLGEC